MFHYGTMVNISAMIAIGRRALRAVPALLIGAILGLVMAAHLAAAAPPASRPADWPGPLVDAAWLKDHLGSDNLVVVEIGINHAGASFMDFTSGHIPGAVFTNYLTAGWRQTDARGIPGQLPPPDVLERLIGGLGLDRRRGVVLVAIESNVAGIAAAARIYWTLKVAGLDRLALLDGGKAAWRRLAGAPLETGPAHPRPTRFRVQLRRDMILYADDVARLQARAGAVLIDHRSPAEYRGERPVRGTGARGTIPGAINIQQTRLLGADGRFRPRSELRALYAMAGLPAPTAEVAFCASGHRAALGWFVERELLGHDSYLFDGSMEEWSRLGRPVVPGRTIVPPAPSQPPASND